MENLILKYSPEKIPYDKTRHIPVEEAKELIISEGLNTRKLSHAINEKNIWVYNFDGTNYLDRIDIGRIYHTHQKRKAGLTIERYFTKKGKDPFDSVEFEERNLEIKDSDGNIIFKLENAYFPKSWSDNSAKIVASKYFFTPEKEEWKEALKQKIKRDKEYSPTHLIDRVTNFIADEGWKLGYFASKKDKDAFADELKWLQINQRFAFNSPVQFNAGIYNKYGISGSYGINYWKDPETGKVIKVENGEYIHPQCHACFIKGPRDDLESILQHVVDEGAVFASGSGIGQDIGVLRAEGELLSGGGKASGPRSFTKILDDGAGTIKSGGKSRRAARHTSMRYHHPDIVDFIRSKVEEDKKVKILIENGYDSSMDGEAVKTVTLQNTNISVRLDDEFFEQVENDKEIELRYVKSGKPAGRIPARKMLQEIAFGSWRVGDPGVQYESMIQFMHTTKNSGKINSSNPCSEYMSNDDTSCNLHSQNLIAYADEKGNFDVAEFERGIWLASIASDIFNDAACYPIKSIAMISPEFRTIGVGYANLGALLMRKGIPYNSKQGRALAGAIATIMTGVAYNASIDIAEKLGTFTHFEFNRNPMLEVMERHRKNIGKLEENLGKYIPNDMKKAAQSLWNRVIEKGKEVGFRNAQATLLAPTGTISYLMDCDTTGVEPATALAINKNLAGGGNIKISNKEVPNALKNLGYNKKQREEIVDYISEDFGNDVLKNTVIGAPHLNPDHYGVFETALGNFDGKGALPFEAHIKMLGAIQPFISGAISKTNNLPEIATVKDIYDGYILGHELGIKALTVFRNNSKPTSALNLGNKTFRRLERGEKEDLPDNRDSYEWEVKIGNDELSFHVIVGDYPDGRPGQITFLSYKAGSTVGSLLSNAGIMASKGLKSGMTLEEITNAWLGHQLEPKGFISGHKYIKTCSSPLDFAARLLRLEYLRQMEMAEGEMEVNQEDLRGFQNGAFRTYERMKISDWDFKQVIEDSEYGGFVKRKKDGELPKSKSEKRKNLRGVPCIKCGNIMTQTGPGCFQCENCAEKIGGCGL